MRKKKQKTKTQISFAVTAKLISAFVLAIRIAQSLYYLNPKFQASNHLLSQYSLVCVGPVRKPRRPVFSQRGSNNKCIRMQICPCDWGFKINGNKLQVLQLILAFSVEKQLLYHVLVGEGGGVIVIIIPDMLCL